MTIKYLQNPETSAHDLPDLPDLPDYVNLRMSTRARRLALRLDQKERRFDLVVPKGVSLYRAQDFAAENDKWMLDKLKDLPRPISLTHNNSLPLFGALCRIQINSDSSLKRTSISLKNNNLLVSTNLDDPSSRIARFLKKLAKERLTELSHEKAARIGKKIRSVSVRDTKSRWGSCSDSGNLSYSWRLIFAPYASFDYVVAHEVAHLKHLDHSRKFWNLCRDLSDDFVEGQYWMQAHGHELMRYG